MLLPFNFDFKNPDYPKVFAHRVKMLRYLENPSVVVSMKEYYRTHIPQFITDWGITTDPRNVEVGLPVNIPFILFDRQIELVEKFESKWRARENLLCDKTREVGLTWLAIAFSCSLCLFYEGINIGFGSRKEEYVDKIGDPKCLFWKARKFVENLPACFRPGYNSKTDAPHMRIMFNATRSAINGEAGDNIGRGDRKSIYFVDESAYLERAKLIEASLSATTNCRIDISSAKTGTVFAERRFSGKVEVFTFHWRDDPRKGEEWYAKQKATLDEVTLAQEVDINYNASLDGVIIPSLWVQAAINAHEKLNIEPTGRKIAALDVADEGKDLNAAAARYGFLLSDLKEWSGKDSDTLYTTEKMFQFCDDNECIEFQYDADGIGAGIRGDTRMINERRKANGQSHLNVVAFRGSGEVIEPEKQMVKGRKNKDYFANRKAQQWWHLRLLFSNTFRALQGEEFDKENIISISGNLPKLTKLMMELSQPTYSLNVNGKILVNKAPDGTRSPNLADSVMIVYSMPKRHNGLFM